MIYSKNINEITFKDITDFCEQQVVENLYLDYKEDINPSSLPKTISAMANTFGGIIIIGVKDEDSKPKLPITGVDFRDGVREQINNLILSNITPPIFPEVQICKSDDNAKMLVIVRIPQSNMTPHAIMKNTRVYVRTFVSNEPTEDLASLDKIEWLKDRRNKSVDLRKSFYSGSLERYSTLCKQNKLTQEISQMYIGCSPLFPHDILTEPNQLQGYIDTIKSRGMHTQVPYLHDNNNYKPFHSGIYNFSFRNSDKKLYNELNQYGFLFQKHDFGMTERDKYDETKTKLVGYLLIILGNLDLFIEASAKFYNKLGYWGLIRLEININKLLYLEIQNLPAPKGMYYPNDEAKKPVDNEVSLSHECLVSELEDKRTEIVSKLLCKIGWSVGFTTITDEQVKTCLEEHGRVQVKASE